MKIITCENGDGTAIAFPAGPGGAFVLTDATGVLEAKADVLTTQNALSDGVTWQGTRMQKRNIVLTLRDAPNADHDENRAALYGLFKFKSAGTLTLSYGDSREDRCIGYVVESVVADVKKRANAYTVSLLCPSPYWESPNVLTRTLGGSRPLFTFPHAFALEPVSRRDSARAFTIDNAGASDEIGMTITVRAANGTVRNVRITHLETGEVLRLGSSANPMILAPGASVTVTTGRGNKRVLGEEGESLAAYLTEDSEFLQIRRGRNTFSIAADSGDSQLVVSFAWRLVYEGA